MNKTYQTYILLLFRRWALPVILSLTILPVVEAQQAVEFDTAIVEESEKVAEEEQDSADYNANLESDFLAIDPDSTRNFPNYPVRRLSTSALAKYKSDPAFCYVDQPRQLEKKELPEHRNFNFNALLWILIIAAALVILFLFLRNSNLLLFRSSRSIPNETHEEVATDDIFNIEYEKEIQKAVDQKNYRFATRLLFLRLLRNLANKNLIDYRQSGTNLDYLLQLRNSSFYQDFFRVTRAYEYCWYGQFNLTEEKFELVRKDFEQLDQILHS